MSKEWRIRPKEAESITLNPHKGCVTFQRFNGDPLNANGLWSEIGPQDFPPRVYPDVAPGYLPSSVAYCRWYWKSFQPDIDNFDWSAIDLALKNADERGQTLQVRLMPYGPATNDPESEESLPGWFIKKYNLQKSIVKSREMLAPDHDSDDFTACWARVIEAFAERYDNDQRLETFDLSHIGAWGEGKGKCSPENIEKMADIYHSVFSETPVIAMIQARQLKMAPGRGFGWRCDCFGDLRVRNEVNFPPELSTNHMYNVYPKYIAEADAADCWKHGPVIFETCHTPWFWQEANEQYDLAFTCQQGYKYHGSYFMPKSTYLPDEWRDDLANFCDKLGYRFVLRQVEFNRESSKNGNWTFELWCENTGVAPMYRRYDLAVKFKRGDLETVFATGDDTSTWFPGDIIIKRELPAREIIGAGETEVYIGIVDSDKQAKIRFAVKESGDDPWIALGKIKII